MKHVFTAIALIATTTAAVAGQSEYQQDLFLDTFTASQTQTEVNVSEDQMGLFRETSGSVTQDTTKPFTFSTRGEVTPYVYLNPYGLGASDSR